MRTRLAWTAAVPTAALLLFAACGGGSSPGTDAAPGVDGALADGGTTDAGPPNGMFILDNTDIPVITGAITLDVAGGVASLARGLMANGKVTDGGGEVGAYTFDAASGSLGIGDDTNPAIWNPHSTPQTLTVTFGQGSAEVYHRVDLQRVETFPITGEIWLGPNIGPALVNPRVALVGLVRSGNTIGTILLPDADFDQTLTFTNFAASFTMNRTEGALGVERIPYGGAGVAMSVIVVYEDRDGTPGLGRWAFDDCTTPNVDCIRGLSSLVLGYRDGDSTQLAASPYAGLIPGWSVAVNLTRSSPSGLGVGSVDPTKPYAFDVRIDGSAGGVAPPAFTF